MAKSLVVVESPAKAKTIAGYLGSGFVVEACMGNVRDLPSGADEIPATHKDKPWARLGVDTEGNFEPPAPGSERYTTFRALAEEVMEVVPSASYQIG